MNNGDNGLSRNGSDMESFRVGEWFVEPALKQISRGGESQQVEPRIMHVLTCLARRPGRGSHAARPA